MPNGTAKYKSFIRWARDTNSGTELAEQQEFIQEIVNNNTFVTNVVNNQEFITQITNNQEFITQLIENNQFITQLIESNNYITNITNQVNANINGRKGIANELATLDASGQVLADQLGMEGVGDMIFGGSGTVTGYSTNLALSALGAVGTIGPVNNATSGNEPQYFYDGNDATFCQSRNAPNAGAWMAIDLQSPHFIGKVRMKQGTDADTATGIVVESSSDATNWVVRYTREASAWSDETWIIPTPASARHWRVRATAGGGGWWNVFSIELFEVTTSGSGNPTRLAPPPDRRIMSFDPDNSVPQWLEPPSSSGSFSIKSIDGVLQWVEDV